MIRIDDENRFLLYTFLLSTVNIFTFNIKYISLPLVVSETGVVIYFLFKRDLKNFVIYYLLFSSSAIESSLFTLGTSSAEIYTFFNIPFFRTYHLFFMILIAYLINIREQDSLIFNLNTLSGKAAALFVIGCCATCITFIIDDNGIADIPGMYRYIIIDTYNSLWLLFLFAFLWDMICKYEDFRAELSKLIFGVLCGVVPAGCLALLCEQVYSADSSNIILTVPVIIFFSPGLILFYNDDRRGIKYFLFGVASILIQIRYSSGIPGAWWLYIAAIVIALIIKVIINTERRKISLEIYFTHSFFLICLLIIIVYLLYKGLNPNRSYISYKLSSVIKLLNIKQGLIKWYDSIGDSIGIRFDAIVNCLIEICRSPFYLLFGKGYGGSVKHNWGTYNWNLRGSSYPDIQIESGVYSSFHTGIAELIINFGMIGIVVMVVLGWHTIKSTFNKEGNPYLVIGFFWLLVMLYFYHSMFLCVAVLAYGIYKCKYEEGIKDEKISVY